MAERLEATDLRREFRLSEGKSYFAAYTESHQQHFRDLERYRAAMPNMTLVDYFVNLHIFVGEVTAGEGSREAEIVHSLALPRRTVRGSLKRLIAWGLVVRLPNGCHHSSKLTARLANEGYEGHRIKAINLYEATTRFREAVRRNAP